MTATTPHKRAEIEVSAILQHPKNPRRKLGDLRELTESIKTQGVLQDLVIIPGGIKGTYIAIAGHRRHAAAKKAGLTRVPCVIREDLVGDDAAQIQAMLSENLQRSDLNVVEEGDAYQDLLDLGVKPAEIAKSTGRTQKLVKDRAKVAGAPEELRTKLIAREATLEEVLTLQSFAAYPTIYEHLSEYLGTHNWAFKVAWAKEDVKRQKEIAKVTAALAADGVHVVPNHTLQGKYLAARSKERGENLYWEKLPERPYDAESPDVVAAFEYGDPGKIVWCRLLTEQDADEPGEDVLSASAEAAATKIISAKDKAAAKEAARAETERIGADLAIAATVRRDHVRQVLHDGGDADQDIATACLHATVEDTLAQMTGDELEYAAELGGVNAADYEEPEDIERAIVGAVEKFNLPQLAILLRVLDKASNEKLLATEHGWEVAGYSRPEQDGWRQEIANIFGYEWSDIELEMIGHLELDTAATE